MSLDLVGGGTGRSGGLKCHLAATDVSEVGIIAEISALIAGVEFGHSNVSLLLLDVTVRNLSPQGLCINTLVIKNLPSEPGGSRTHDLRIKSPLLYQLSYAL